MKKSKKIKNQRRTQPRKFNIESVNGIELAHTTITMDETLSDEHEKHIGKLSEIADRKYGSQGRGSFLIVSESHPNQAVYIPVPDLLECIRQLIPEALNRVRDVVNQYDPKEQFVVINVFNRKRIAITTELLRLTV